ncbi:ankyrin repeat-containing domain protein [Daldinia vernicosa]|uniref:ankyrin repeat-containing domain protein n=1 Tax=Daldinia vernicosa TaxID=114800 RepID=UPI0020080A82|nr:ankyrin repeat-containing domain protein [Daldinia vernicosa]KAI0849090.1 ankyrin repeat-containing domain protein [Daldinia vernicosa]
MDMFKECTTLEIRASEGDVRRYVEDHMEQLPSFVRESEMKEEVVNTVSGGVDGMFLLAQLYLGFLDDKTTIKEVKTALKSFQKQSEQPTEDMKVQVLNDAYEIALERINGQKRGFRTLAFRVFSWITCASRPLNTLELQHALAVEVGEKELDNDNVTEVELIISVCAGILRENAKTLVSGSTCFYNESLRYIPFLPIFRRRDAPNAGRGFKAMQVTPFLSLCSKLLGISCPVSPYRPSMSGGLSFMENSAQVEASGHAITYYPVHWSGGTTRGLTGLHLASYFNLPNELNYIVDNQNLEAQDSKGRTPLIYAVIHKHETIIKLLVGKGANIETRGDEYKRTPLLWAVFMGLQDIAMFLIEKGADLHARDFKNNTALHFSVRSGLQVITRALLERGADANVMDSSGYTPLMMAANKCNKTEVQLLLNKGADINVATELGEAPLTTVIRKGREDIAQLLLEHGANIKAQDMSGYTALHIASLHEYGNVFQLLLQHGASVEDLSFSRRTPLHLAVQEGHEGIARLLLENGANIEARDDIGMTALHLAVFNQHESLVRLLLDHGSNTQIGDDFGRTALQCAIYYRHKTVARLLREHATSLTDKAVIAKATSTTV